MRGKEPHRIRRYKKMKNKQTGIYKVSCGKFFYIGQSTNIQKRGHQHRYLLKNSKKLANRKLLEAYKDCGTMEVSVILYCKKEDLDYYEQMMIDMNISNPFCCNIWDKADRRGCSPPRESREASIQSKTGKPYALKEYEWEHKDGQTDRGDYHYMINKYGLVQSNLYNLVKSYEEEDFFLMIKGYPTKLFSQKGWGIKGWQERKKEAKNK